MIGFAAAAAVTVVERCRMDDDSNEYLFSLSWKNNPEFSFCYSLATLVFLWKLVTVEAITVDSTVKNYILGPAYKVFRIVSGVIYSYRFVFIAF